APVGEARGGRLGRAFERGEERRAEVDDGGAPRRVAAAVDRKRQGRCVEDDLRTRHRKDRQQVVARGVGRGEGRTELAVEAQRRVEEGRGRVAVLGQERELGGPQRRRQRHVESDEQR